MDNIEDEILSLHASTARERGEPDTTIIGIQLHLEDKQETHDRRLHTFYKSSASTIEIARSVEHQECSAKDGVVRANFSSLVMSRRHATIRFMEDGSVAITDTKSLHGTHLERNGRSFVLAQLKACRLQNHDIVRFGKTVSRANKTVEPVSVRVELLYADASEHMPSSGLSILDSKESDVPLNDVSAPQASHIITPNRYGLFMSPSPSPSVSATSSEDELDEDSGSSQLADDSPSSSSPETPARISRGPCRFPITSFTGNLPSLRQTGLLSRHLSHSQTSNISSFVPTSFNDHSYISFDDELDFDIPSYAQNQLGEESDSPIYHMDLPSESDEGSGHCGRNRREEKDDLASDSDVSDMQISRANSPALPPSPGPVIIGAWPGSPAPVSDDEEIVSSVADVGSAKDHAVPGAVVPIISTVQTSLPDVIDVDALPTPMEREVIWIEDDIAYPMMMEPQSLGRYASPFVLSAPESSSHWARSSAPSASVATAALASVPAASVDVSVGEIHIEAPQAVRPIDPIQVGLMSVDANDVQHDSESVLVPSSCEPVQEVDDKKASVPSALNLDDEPEVHAINSNLNEHEVGSTSPSEFQEEIRDELHDIKQAIVDILDNVRLPDEPEKDRREILSAITAQHADSQLSREAFRNQLFTELSNMQESTINMIRSEMQAFCDMQSNQTVISANGPPATGDCLADVEMSDSPISEQVAPPSPSIDVSCKKRKRMDIEEDKEITNMTSMEPEQVLPTAKRQRRIGRDLMFMSIGGIATWLALAFY